MSTELMPTAKEQFFYSPDGLPLEGGKLYTYAAGTTTLKATFTDSAGTTPQTNPIILNARGEPDNAIFWDGAYKVRLEDANGTLIYTVDNYVANVAGNLKDNLLSVGGTDSVSGTWFGGVTASVSALASSIGSSLLGFVQTGGGAVMRSIQTKVRETVSVTDYAGIVADGTDQTAKIVAWFGTLGPAYTGVVVIPYNVKFNATTVYAAIPPRVLVKDDSVINTANPTGYFPRATGLISNCDTANTDTSFVLSDSHNANMVIENRGTAPTTSALNRVVAVLWGVGRFLRGQPGIRSLGRWEFANIAGLDKWSWVIRRYLPWVARESEYWTASTVIPPGSYIISDPERIYMTVAGGTTGLVAPTHTSGTAVDGTVTWTFVSGQTDSVCFGVNENGELATNAAPTQSVVAYLRANPDSGGSAVLIVEAVAINKRAELRLRPSDAAGAAITALPSISAVEDATLRLRSSTLLRDMFVASDAGGFNLGVYGHTEATAADLSTTPSVQNCGLLKIFNSAATLITDFLNGTSTQEVTLFFQNGNTTLVHNASILSLKGAVNVMPTANQMIVIKKYTGSLVWFEKSRNF